MYSFVCTTILLCLFILNDNNNNKNDNKKDRYGSCIWFVDAKTQSNGGHLRTITSRGGNSDHGNGHQQQQRRRGLQTPYSVTVDDITLGSTNLFVASSNPFRGLVVNPNTVRKPYDTSIIQNSLEKYYIGIDEVMRSDPRIYGEKAFNWSGVDAMLEESASRGKHVIWRFVYDYPDNPLHIPEFMLDGGLKMVVTKSKNSISPVYDDPLLLNVTKLFIQSMGRRYSDDKRLAVVQLGILGYWGEWHCLGDPIIPDSAKESIMKWYATAFASNTGMLQVRYPDPLSYSYGMGHHDDSFAYSTLDGKYNGGVVRNFFFWPKLINLQQTNFWHDGMMGGESRPEVSTFLWNVNEYKANTEYRQDIESCIRTTHSSYMKNSLVFLANAFTPEEMKRARYIHSIFGYAFRVNEISVVKPVIATSSAVEVHVIVEQIGIAPFYYPLHILIECSDMNRKPIRLTGVHNLIEKGEKIKFEFTNIPNTRSCLENINVRLDSPKAYNDINPIKWAQGNGTVSVSLVTKDTPPSSSSTTYTADQPISSPIDSPVKPPVSPPIVLKSPIVPTPPKAPLQVDPPVSIKAPVQVPVVPPSVPTPKAPLQVDPPVSMQAPVQVPVVPVATNIFQPKPSPPIVPPSKLSLSSPPPLPTPTKPIIQPTPPTTRSVTTAPAIVVGVVVPNEPVQQCREVKCNLSLGRKGIKVYKKRRIRETIFRGTAVQQILPTCTEKCITKFTRLFYSKEWSTCRC